MAALGKPKQGTRLSCLRDWLGFGIGQPSKAHLPAGGADLQVTSQADGTIGQVQGGGEGKAQRSGGVLIGAADSSRVLTRNAEIRLSAPGAGLTANPLGVVALVVVAVAVQAVAMGTERGAVFIEAAAQTGERIIIPGVMAQLDGAQGFEILVDEGQDLRIAFSSIAQHFADGETRGNAAAAVGNRGWSAGGRCGWQVRRDRSAARRSTGDHRRY